MDKEYRKRVPEISRDDSLVRHFDRFYSRISETNDNQIEQEEAVVNHNHDEVVFNPQALNKLSCKVSPSLCADHHHHPDHQSACLHPNSSTHAQPCSNEVVTINIYNTPTNVKTHRTLRRINVGRRIRTRLLRHKKFMTSKHALPVVDVHLKMEQQLVSSMLFGGFHSKHEENNRVGNYQLHLFTDQLASIIELINQYDRDNRNNEAKHKSTSDVDKIQSISGGGKPRRLSKRILSRSHSWRISKRRPQLKPSCPPLTQTTSVDDYIEKNRDTIKQIGSPWKNFVVNSSSASSSAHPLMTKVESLHAKEVQVYETMFEVIYSEYAYLQVNT